jgi:hypothetical protein
MINKQYETSTLLHDFISDPLYPVGTPMSVSGSGFTAGQLVSIQVQGQAFYSDATMADKKGNISLNYPGGLNLIPGYYSLTAFQSNGTSASTGFEAQY